MHRKHRMSAARSALRCPLLIVSLVALLATVASAQRSPTRPASAHGSVTAVRPRATTSAAQATARYLESIRDNPALVAAFLREMPKGADLHNHLSGAVYAESFLRWAAEDSLCIVRVTLVAAPGPCDPANRPAASAAMVDAGLYGAVIDAWSMRNWRPALESGHDRFFATFARFGGATNNRTGDMLAEAARLAADDRVSYVETMLTPERQSVQMARRLGWTDDFAAMRQRLLSAGFRDSVVPAARLAIDSAEARERKLLGCTSAVDSSSAGPCSVTIRYLYQVSRGRSPEEVFAQILAGFETATADARFVGLNLVQPEDAFVALRDYDLQMRMIGFLRPLYPAVHVSLHAGELAPGLVPPGRLRDHIRQAVEIAGAQRIGHGVDVMHESRPAELLREMADRSVLVEICLTSNDVILGVSGRDHPLREYLDAGVPVALATDDQGVARSDMTAEYEKAVLEQGLSYTELKAMTRNGLEHAFIGGASLWRDARRFEPVSSCAASALAPAGSACRAFLDRNPRARLQWALERSFEVFEARQGMGRSAAPAAPDMP